MKTPSKYSIFGMAGIQIEAVGPKSQSKPLDLFHKISTLWRKFGRQFLRQYKELAVITLTVSFKPHEANNGMIAPVSTGAFLSLYDWWFSKSRLQFPSATGR